MPLKLNFKVRLLCWRCTTRMWQRPLLGIKPEPILDLSLPPLIEVETCDKPKKGLLSLHQNPGNVTIKTGLTRRTLSLSCGGKGSFKARVHNTAWKQSFKNRSMGPVLTWPNIIIVLNLAEKHSITLYQHM